MLASPATDFKLLSAPAVAGIIATKSWLCQPAGRGRRGTSHSRIGDTRRHPGGQTGTDDQSGHLGFLPRSHLLEVEGLGVMAGPYQLGGDSFHGRSIDRESSPTCHEKSLERDDPGREHHAPLRGVPEPDIEEEVGLAPEEIPNAHAHASLDLKDLKKRVVRTGHRPQSGHFLAIGGGGDFSRYFATRFRPSGSGW